MNARSTLAVLLLAAPAAATEIQHDPVGCVVVDVFPRLEARFSPVESVARARVRFRPANGAHWYSVAMKPEKDVFTGVLPKPTKKLEALDYYIEVIDAATTPTRTDEHRAVVASGPAACQDKKVASTLGSASVLLEGPAGAPPLPAGFASGGVSTSAAAAGTTAAVAGGGGAPTALLVGGGLALAGGAAVVATKGGSGDGGGGNPQPSPQSGPTPAPGPTPTPGTPQPPGSSPAPGGPPGSAIWSMRFGNPPGISLAPCGSNNLTWASQAFTVFADGSFDTTWSPNEPNTARFRGNVSGSTFDATLSCVSNGNSVRFTASGGPPFSGTFSFGSSSGSWSAFPQ